MATPYPRRMHTIDNIVIYGETTVRLRCGAGADGVADPYDRGMLDVVGFDTSVPAVISDFVRAA